MLVLVLVRVVYILLNPAWNLTFCLCCFADEALSGYRNVRLGAPYKIRFYHSKSAESLQNLHMETAQAV